MSTERKSKFPGIGPNPQWLPIPPITRGGAVSDNSERAIADDVSVGDRVTITFPDGSTRAAVVLREYAGGSVAIDYMTAEERATARGWIPPTAGSSS